MGSGKGEPEFWCAVVKPGTPSGSEAMQPIPQALSAIVTTAPA